MQGLWEKEFSKNYQELRINPVEATIAVRDLRIYDILIVSLVLWKYIISHDSVFWYMFSSIMKVFRTFGDRNIVLGKSSFCFRQNWRLITHDLRKALWFPVN